MSGRFSLSLKFRELGLVAAGVAALVGAGFAVADLFHALGQAQALYSVGMSGLSIEADLQDQTQESRRVFVYALTSTDPNVQLPYVNAARAADEKINRLHRAFSDIQLNSAARKQLSQFALDWKAYLSGRDQMIGYILEDRSDLALAQEQSQGAPLFEKCARRLQNLKRLLDEYARNQLVAVQRTYYRCAVEVGFFILTVTLLIGSVRLLAGLRRRNKELIDSESLERQRSEILHSISISSPLESVFRSIVKLVERQLPNARGSVFVLEREHLWFSCAPDLPAELVRALDGQALGDSRSHSARAARLCETVIQAAVSGPDVQPCITNPLSGDLVRAHWSVPIRGNQQKVLGTLDVFFVEKVGKNQDESVRFVERMAQLAALAFEHKSVNDQLAYQAQHDSLTGLANRVMFQERLDRAIARASVESLGLSVLWIDLDRFKQVNDVLGHQTGDALLQQIARRLGQCITDSDLVARIGGDEFVILLERDSSETRAIEVAQSVLRRLNEPVLALQHEVSVGASIGIGLFPEHGEDRETLLRSADTAMYSVKYEGKNTYRVYDPKMGTDCAETLELERQLRIALQEKQFTLSYQPQVANDGTIRCIEALMRWNSPSFGPISPSRFIPIAEENGLIVPLGAWALREACFQAEHWNRKSYDPVRIAVNVSAHQFTRSDFVETVACALRDSGLEPCLLELELTETSVMRNLENTMLQFQKLRRLGIRISIDDFGTGNSSLSYLRQLPVDALKIDRSFIEGLCSPGRDSLLLVRAIIGMAHGLQLEVVAEGIETENQLNVLRNEGCDLHQGFLLYKPLSDSEIERVLVEKPVSDRYLEVTQTRDLVAIAGIAAAGTPEPENISKQSE